jgi:quercetin dioxygenase-like cupin family protein
MIIQEIKQLLTTSIHPVARALYLKEHLRVLAIGFKSDMILKDHKTPYDSKLVILEGKVIYKEGDKEIELKQYDEYLIPKDMTHSVTATEDSLCFLIQS